MELIFVTEYSDCGALLTASITLVNTTPPCGQSRPNCAVVSSPARLGSNLSYQGYAFSDPHSPSVV